MNNSKRIIYTVMFLWMFSNYTSTLLLGDRADTSNSDSFSFTLLTKAVFDSSGELFYVANADSTALSNTQKQYALTGFSTKITTGTSASPETAIVNGSEQDSPLYGARFAQIGMSGKEPLVVLNSNTNALYWATSRLGVTPQTVVGVTSINDANATSSSGIITVANNAHGNPVVGTGGNYVCAAVGPNGGDFGSSNGGIALFLKTNSSLTQQKAVDGDDSNTKAVEVAVDTSVLKIGDADLTSLVAHAVDMHWDSALNRFFIAVRISDAGTDGGRALFTARIAPGVDDKSKLHFHEIAPAAAFTTSADNEIVGERAGNDAIDIYRVRTMHPSIGGSYVIVQTDKIYCLPLVNNRVNPASTTWNTSSSHARLAKPSSGMTDYYATNAKGITYLAGRGFTTQATTAGDLYNTTDDSTAITVGSGAVKGTISDIQVHKDTVFVSTKVKASTILPGVFYSQALFDANGVIASWTPWTKIATTTTEDAGIEAFGYGATEGTFFTLEGAQSSGTVTPDSVRYSTWGENRNNTLLGGTSSDASVGLIELLNTAFPASQGGVMGLFDFPSSLSAFTSTAASKLSLLVATGYEKVVIVKTSAATGSDNDLIPTTGDFTTAQRTFTSGAISNDSIEGAGVTSTTEFIEVTGGDLTGLGAITCATIVTDSTNGGYLVVGGINGVAVLKNNSHAGWATTGLVKDLSTGFSTNLAFTEIGSYTNVRKLWTATDATPNDGDANDYLYILTDDTLYRIAASDFNAANPTATTLATLSGLNLPSHASFTDFIASFKLGLLATSAGLYRSGNSTNIATAANESAVSWTTVSLYDGFNGVTKLVPLSKTVPAYHFASAGPGQVYALSSVVGKNMTYIHQLAIESIASSAVASTTVQEVYNPYLKDTNAAIVHVPFSYCGAYRNNFDTNGATLLASSAQLADEALVVNRLPQQLGLLAPFNASMQKQLPLGISTQDSIPFGFIRNSATGTWLIYGDFGVRTLE